MTATIPGKKNGAPSRKSPLTLFGLEHWKCSVCRHWKLRIAFHVKQTAANGLTSACRECYNAAQRRKSKTLDRPNGSR